MARPTITAALASAVSRAQVAEIVRATEIALDADSVKLLNSVSDTPPPLSRTRAGAGVAWTSARARQEEAGSEVGR